MVMADSGSSDSSNQGSSSVSNQEKVPRNKRKYLPEFSLDVPNDVSVSLTEFPRYELLAKKFQNTLSDPGSLEAKSRVEELHHDDWDDPIAYQLEELLSLNLSATFQSAIKKIANNGYSEEVSEWAILRSGLYYGSKDPVSNIVDGALVFLKRENEYDICSHRIFEDLENLVEYTMLEMICVLREVKPSLTIAEAMWFLLICDLNLSYACSVEGDSLSVFGGKEIPRESSSDSTLSQMQKSDALSDSTPAQLKSEALISETVLSTPINTYISKPSMSNAQKLWSEMHRVGGILNLPDPMCPFVHEVTTPANETRVSVSDAGGKSLGITGEYVQSMCQLSAVDEKSGSSGKGCMVNSKRDMLRLKSFHVEKHCKGHVSKGTLRAKFSTWSGLVLDKKVKSPSDSSGVNIKTTSSKTSIAVGVNMLVAKKTHHHSNNTPSALAPTDNPAPLPSNDIVSALPAANAKLHSTLHSEKNATLKPQVSVPASPKIFDCYAGIPYDKCLGKYVPQNAKDELILMLVPRLQILQKELDGWTDWANQKVMQAARRLGKDLAELKALRQEKEEAEKFEKEKHILEENTVKRLSEMVCALDNATSQVEMANTTVRRLEEKNSVLKKEMEAAGLQALGSAANLQEALLREQDALKRVQSWDAEKSLLQEEVSTDKHQVAVLQHVLEKAKGLYNQIEGRHKQEEKVKEKLLIEASSIRKKREHLESLAKAEEDVIRQKAENELQKYKEDIKKLECKISELILESEASKIAALRGGIDGIHGSYPTECKDFQARKVTKRLAVFWDNFGGRSARAERECVMCLTEEISVVFLPCAHQALCVNCNELHEKQGMNDCPSCRTPIKRRIKVRFASP